MTALILGTDPGLGGALALYNPITDHLLQVYDMPVCNGSLNLPALVDVIRAAEKSSDLFSIHAIIENVHSRPRQAGAFAFGFNTGAIHGILATLGIPISTVSPNLWKPACHLTRRPGETQPENKTRARELASQMWPAQAHLFKRIRDDGRAEAALIAYWYAHLRKEK